VNELVLVSVPALYGPFLALVRSAHSEYEGISPENSECSSASLPGSDIALPNAEKVGSTNPTRG